MNSDGGREVRKSYKEGGCKEGWRRVSKKWTRQIARGEAVRLEKVKDVREGGVHQQEGSVGGRQTRRVKEEKYETRKERKNNEK